MAAAGALHALDLNSSRIHFSSSLADSDPIWPLNRSNNALNDELENDRVRAGPNVRPSTIGNAGSDIQRIPNIKSPCCRRDQCWIWRLRVEMTNQN